MSRRMTIEHRDALIYMLSEAAELEHGIMCQYLFAAFSLKTSTEEGVDERQLRAIDKWRKIVFRVAAEEMLHLALANNLLSAIGAAPRVGRPNLPHAGRYYPPGVQLALVPFSERALRHFLYLERPEGINLQDAEGFEALREAEPLMSERSIVPRPQHFATVGELYRAIEDGFDNLVDYYGERWLFIGPRRAQATAENFWWPELIPVTDLESAKKAIATIVEQGEGARGHWRDAHYGRFLEVLGEYLTLRRAHPTFQPARSVLAACVREPVDAAAVPLVSDPLTARVLDAFNVAYEVILYALGRFFGHVHETEKQHQTLADVAVELMVGVLKPLGEMVTTLPVGPEYPGMTAGPSFEVFYRSGYLLPHTEAAWVLLHERLLELYGFLMATLTQAGAPQGLAEVGDALLELAQKLAAEMEGLGERRIRVPPSWGLGAVQPEGTTVDRAQPASQDSTAESPTDRAPQPEARASFVTVGRADDVPEGEMRMFEVGRQRIAVANSGGSLYAFGDVCKHRGCPLHEGRLEGTTVTCPCHGSRFDVRTGQVMSGPATEPEPVFETSLEGGDLKIRI
ncbi:MAG: ferritin-like domain-containing protein [Actinomycetota bacterium]